MMIFNKFDILLIINKNIKMKKEILLLSSLISLALVFYLAFPNNEKSHVQEDLIADESELKNSSMDQILNEDVLLKFDLVRLEPNGDVIMAGKTEPDIKIDIFDGNEKLSSVTSDSHGDWIWISQKKIEKGLKRFHLKHLDSEGKVSHSRENVIIFFEKDVLDNQKIVKVMDKENVGIEILNKKEIKGLALDSVEHFGNNQLRIKGRSIPNSKIKFSLSGKLIGNTYADSEGVWEFGIDKIKFNTYNLVVESFFQNNILSLKTEILNGKINEKLFFEKKFIVEEGNSLWRIARKTLGGGILYAEIYKNNKKIINDPDLIFPGQVFKIPNLKQTSLYEQRQ